MRPFYIFSLLIFSVLAEARNIDSLRSVLSHKISEKDRVKTLNALAGAYKNLLPDSTIYFGNAAHDLAVKLKDDAGQAEAMELTGYGYLRNQQYGIARPYFNRALALWKAIGDLDKVNDVYFSLGFMADQQGDFPEALKQYLSCLKIREQKGDSVASIEVRMSIGNTYSQMGDKLRAINILKSVINSYSKMNDSLGMAKAYANLGTILDEAGESDESLVHLKKALIIAKALKQKMGESIILGSIANHYQRLQQYDTSLAYSREAMQLFTQMNNHHNLSAIQINIGQILTKLRRYDEAETSIRKGLELAQKLGLLQWIINAHGSLYELEEERGDYKRALEEFILFKTFQDSMVNEDNTRKVIQVQMQYDFDKKEAIDKALQEKKDQRQRILRNSITAGLVFVLIFFVVVLRQRNRISKEKARSEELLLNILPGEVAEELKSKGETEAVHLDMVTVLFTDFKGFTSLSEKLSPRELVRDLNECFSAFDRITMKYRIEKIKTIGDAYMAAGGLPTPNNSHAEDVIKAALEMVAFVAEGKAKKQAAGLPYFEVRIGIHTGPVVAGIVGIKKFQYDIWGDTVNTASRMESSGEVGRVNISSSTYELVRDKFTFEYRGKIVTKGKGEMEMYFVNENLEQREG